VIPPVPVRGFDPRRFGGGRNLNFTVRIHQIPIPIPWATEFIELISMAEVFETSALSCGPSLCLEVHHVVSINRIYRRFCQ
jgi:hypothetical protein